MRVPFRVLRGAAAVGFAAAAVNHAILASRGVGDVGRHLVFVGIDALLGVLVVARPRFALWPVCLLALQQIPSHGMDLVRSFDGPGPRDWPSLGVILFFPALITLLVVERRESRPVPPREEPRRS